jgi:hypothetical protein
MRPFLAEVLTECGHEPLPVMALATRLGAELADAQAAMSELASRGLAVCDYRTRICRLTPTGRSVVRQGAQWRTPAPIAESVRCWASARSSLQRRGWEAIRDADGFVASHRGLNQTIHSSTIEELLLDVAKV